MSGPARRPPGPSKTDLRRGHLTPGTRGATPAPRGPGRRHPHRPAATTTPEQDFLFAETPTPPEPPGGS